MTTRVIDAFTQFFDASGNPLAAGKMKFLENGSSSVEKDTYQNAELTIANTNPVILDGEGRIGNVFGEGAYRAILLDANDVQIQLFDDVNLVPSGAQFNPWSPANEYFLNDFVSASGAYYRCIVSSVTGVDPTTGTSDWVEVPFTGIWRSSITYAAGDSAYGSNGILYTSRVSANLNNEPSASPAEWASDNVSELAGNIIMTASATAPTGYLLCDGSAISRTDFADLFARIGTAYGVGDGSTTFNIPDTRGEFLRGNDNGRGIDTGRVLGSSQSDAIRNIVGETYYSSGGTGLVLSSASQSGAFTKGTVSTGSQFSGTAGSSVALKFDASLSVPTASENRPRNVSFNFAIRY